MMLASRSFGISPTVYAFGPFRFDPERALLTCNSKIVALPQRLLEILQVLVEANGALVTREKLCSIIWPGRGMPENNLSQHVYMLRRALGERAGDRLYIVTVHNRGFRFVPPIKIERVAEHRPGPLVFQSSDRNWDPPGSEIFQRYCKGFESFERGGGTDLRAAIEHLEAVLQTDPEYVPALVALSRARLQLALQCYVPAEQQSARAKSAATRALAIEPSNAVAHATLSKINLFFDWNWHDAKRRLDTAVELNPENTVVRSSIMWLYAWIGQSGRAVLEAQRAVMSHPSSVTLQMLLGRALIGHGDYSDAFHVFSHVIESHPERAAQAHCQRAQTLILARQPDRAIFDLQLLPQDRDEDLAWRLPLLVQAYADDGQRAKAENVYQTLVSASIAEYVARTNLIAPALSLGRDDEALGHLERAVAKREPAAPLLRYSSRLAAIRKSDAFKSLIAAMGW